MNIQQYYQQSAAVSLNAGLAAFIPSIVILIYVFFISHFYQLIILVSPFLIYSFFCYQKYLLNQKRAKAVKWSSTSLESSDQNLFAGKLLFAFLPAPSLRLLLFTPNGKKAGEIRDQSFSWIKWFTPNFLDRLFVNKYILIDDSDQPIAFFRDLKDRIEIISPANEKVVVFKLNGGKKKEYCLENKRITIKNSSLQDYYFLLPDETILAEIQTGWMPIEWGDRFVDSNTPILTMKGDWSEREIVQLFSLLVCLYKFRNH
ncbi:hypothetical protein [Bacillus tuaregi]|uniref:hypothetical protein n=1 Tax=Bacillus tuaregi TaxID=1816695 RepID=UPI0008F85399|nr:hypothetical protein [Bacillus tuaregi]